MNFGSAVHSALLEDSNDIVVLPEFNARTNEGKKIKQDFINDNVGKIVIKQEEKEAIEKIKNNFNNHSLAKSLVKRLTET